jgi:hypothetical protein
MQIIALSTKSISKPTLPVQAVSPSLPPGLSTPQVGEGCDSSGFSQIHPSSLPHLALISECSLEPPNWFLCLQSLLSALLSS